MSHRRSSWLLAVAALILLCYFVPFVLLHSVDAWYGSFLFWSLATVAVIGINIIISADWKD